MDLGHCAMPKVHFVVFKQTLKVTILSFQNNSGESTHHLSTYQNPSLLVDALFESIKTMHDDAYDKL